MQNPRRPSAERRRASGARDRPISFNRRLEEAREARARVLAAREGQQADDAPDSGTGVPETAGPRGPDEAAPSPEGESPAREPGAVRAAIPWRIAGGFLAGAAAGAVAIWVLLPWGQPTPPGAQIGTAAAPEVASAPPQAPTDDPAEASAAGSEPAPAAVAADDGEGGAEEDAGTAALPEVTAADRARGAGPRPVADADDGAANEADPVTESAESTRTEAAADTILVTEIASRIDVDPAPSRNEAPSPPSDEASAEPQGPPPVEAAGGEGVDVTGEVQGTPDTTDAEAAAVDDGREAAAGEAAAEPAAEEAAPQPDPAPAEEPAPPSDEVEAALEDATGNVSEDATGAAPSAGDGAATPEPAAGIGRVYVHAAPGVTSEELDDVVARLSDAGYAIEDTRRVDFRISQTNVRYFHDGDAEVSAGVAETISGVSRDFTDYDPSPDPGTIEVWLEG